MDPASELSQFLTSRRAKVTPDQAGLPSYGQRRVPGLRREEVASLAGVSAEYYKRLERGNATGASEQVLEALADALRLDDAERAHLFDLAHAAGRPGFVSVRRRSRPVQQHLRPAVQHILDSITAPATVSNMRCDYLAANQLGRALYSPLFESREQPPNSARFTFLDPAAGGAFESEATARWQLLRGGAQPTSPMSRKTARGVTGSAEPSGVLSAACGPVSRRCAARPEVASSSPSEFCSARSAGVIEG